MPHITAPLPASSSPATDPALRKFTLAEQIEDSADESGHEISEEAMEVIIDLPMNPRRSVSLYPGKVLEVTTARKSVVGMGLRGSVVGRGSMTLPLLQDSKFL